jgi:GT2 family glycosyltransferase
MNYLTIDKSEKLTIDVVVPSFRPRVAFLDLLTSLKQPFGVEIFFYIIVDRPGTDVFKLRQTSNGIKNMVVLVNDKNVGTSESRNRGIEAGRGEYILFLDDDVKPHEDLLVEYANAIRADTRNHPGFVGVVNFPLPCNSFTRGVFHSGVLTFFGFAAQNRNMPWGVTANLCLRRKSLGTNRFSRQFPRGGGGEDIDLCLRMKQSSGGKEFLSVPRAQVDHPWWEGGTRSYTRFVRWAYGDSRLPALHPQHRFTNWPTMWETWIVLLLLLGFAPKAIGIVTVGLIASVTSEFLVDFAKLKRRGECLSLLDSVESVLIRLSIDLGRVLCNLSRTRPRGLLEHFDFFCTSQHIGYERRVAAIKTAIVIGAVMVAAIFRVFI